MWKPMLLLTLALSMLTACASGTPPIVGSLPVAPPPTTMRPCASPPASLQTGSRAELLANHVAAMKAYHDCVAANQAKADWINQVVPK